MCGFLSHVRAFIQMDTKGHFDLLIKVYFPQEGRPGGLMSTFLDGLRPGAEVHVRGPLVRCSAAAQRTQQ
jgi:hypothetical protein